ncbi:MAG: hypothetical protein KC766_00560 [Myxococcales bacterium]|nr:hypothetical protein [Myxococcales bacterium]
MRVSTTKRQLGLGLVLVSGLLWATACGRTTIDFGVPEGSGGVGGTIGSGGAGAEGGFGGDAGFGGSGAEGGFGGDAGAGAEGGFGGDAGFGGSGATGGAPDDCLAAAQDDCDVCTCDGCRDEWDTCQGDGGCVAIYECAQDAGCSGAQCLGPCGSVIQQNGGVTGQPAQLALGLGTCQSTTCGSDCNGSGGNGGNGGNGGSGGSGGGGVVDCISCVGQSCPQAQECLLDQSCRDGAICAVTQCLGGGGGGGGGLDFQCLLGCFNGDFNAALSAFNSVQCVFTSCGNECGGLLGGGGGGTPFGGGGGTPFGGFGGGN